MPKDKYPRSPKMRAFCEHLITDETYHATNAAIKAGYPAKSAASQASQIMARPDVQAYLEHLKAERSKKLKIDAEYVLKKLTSYTEADPALILEDDGRYKKLKEWPKEIRLMISYLEMDKEGRPVKVKLVDRLKSTELLGKHSSIKAFSEVIEHKSDPELVRALREGRNRVQQPA